MINWFKVKINLKGYEHQIQKKISLLNYMRMSVCQTYFFLISIAIALATFTGFRIVDHTFKDFIHYSFKLGGIFIQSLSNEKLSVINDTFPPSFESRTII